MYAFLHEEESNLDVGVGMQLQRLAWAQGTAHGDGTRTRRTELLALEWMASALVQGPIYQLCEETLASSLPVERRLGQVKQWETSRSTNIATSSRDMLVVRYAKQRDRLAQVLAASMRKLRRAQKTTVGSMVFLAEPPMLSLIHI